MGQQKPGPVVFVGLREFRPVMLGWEHPREPRAYADGSPRYRPLFSRADLLSRMRNGGEGEVDVGDYMPPIPEGAAFGYALYETTTEGTPASPVLGTMEELALWCEANAAGGTGGTLTRGQWLEAFRQQHRRKFRGHVLEPEL